MTKEMSTLEASDMKLNHKWATIFALQKKVQGRKRTGRSLTETLSKLVKSAFTRGDASTR